MRRALCVLLVVITACSSSGGGAASGGGAPSSSQPSTTSQFCSTFVTNYAALSGRGVGSDAANLRSAFGSIGSVLGDLERLAPTEIKADVDRLTAFLRDYATVLNKYGFDFGRLEQEATADEKAKLDRGDPAEIKSINTIQQFVRSNCTNVTLPSDFSDFS
jgi:hypothetical protein